VQSPRSSRIASSERAGDSRTGSVGPRGAVAPRLELATASPN